MNRRAFLCGLTLGTLIAPLPARAQQAARLYRVGILAPGHEPQPDSTIRYFGPFRQSLADSGYVEGRNVSFAYRWGGGDLRILPALANELVRVGVDVLFAASTPAIRALMGATTTIPIVVVTSVLDPIDAGMAASLARPGGNITGVSGRVLELNEKLLELLKESKPSISRAAVFGHPEAVGRDRQGMEAAAHRLRVQLQFLEVTSLKGLDEAFESAAKARAEGLVLLLPYSSASMRDGSPGLH